MIEALEYKLLNDLSAYITAVVRKNAKDKLDQARVDQSQTEIQVRIE